MRKLNVLLYASKKAKPASAWITKVTSIMLSDPNTNITVLVQDDLMVNVLKELETTNRVRIVSEAKYTGESSYHIIDDMDQDESFNIILLHGEDIVLQSIGKGYQDKVIPYIENEKFGFFKKTKIKQMYEEYQHILLESRQVKELLIPIVGTRNDKSFILPIQEKETASHRIKTIRARIRKKFFHILWSYNMEKETILFAGHDFKFIDWYIKWCEEQGLNVLVDKWKGHKTHDQSQSLEMLQRADIIFCEWGLGNAVWYAANKKKGQKLVIRIHRQELETKDLTKVDYEKVDHIITVSPYILEEFIRLKKLPRHKVRLVPNMVNTERFNLPKKPSSSYHIGILGILPKLKRLDRAIEILERLVQINPKYKLYVKGKLPQDLSWLMGRKEEKEYFDAIFEKIDQSEWKDNIHFDPHGDDVPDWFTNIGFILSTSDIESFHLAPMEGMSSGTIPIIFNWPGAYTIYPKENIVQSVDEAVDLILHHDVNAINKYQQIVNPYSKNRIIAMLDEVVRGIV